MGPAMRGQGAEWRGTTLSDQASEVVVVGAPDGVLWSSVTRVGGEAAGVGERLSWWRRPRHGRSS
jgi:hypothetical protein